MVGVVTVTEGKKKKSKLEHHPVGVDERRISSLMNVFKTKCWEYIIMSSKEEEIYRKWK